MCLDKQQTNENEQWPACIAHMHAASSIPSALLQIDGATVTDQGSVVSSILSHLFLGLIDVLYVGVPGVSDEKLGQSL